MRPRRMRAEPFDLDHDAVGRREQRTWTDREVADRHARHVVHAIDLLDAEALHHAVLDHLAPAAAALFGWLEDHDRRAGKIARFGEVFRRAEEHRGMPVMAAGVHLARVGGAIRQVGLFIHRERVHVGAQPNDFSGALPLATNDADYAGFADAGHDLIAAEGLKFLGYACRGPVYLEQNLGVGVHVAPPCGDLRLHV